MLIKVARAGQVIGEYTAEALRVRIRNQSVLATDHYWYEGMSAWESVADFEVDQPPVPSGAALARSIRGHVARIEPSGSCVINLDNGDTVVLYCAEIPGGDQLGKGSGVECVVLGGKVLRAVISVSQVAKPRPKQEIQPKGYRSCDEGWIYGICTGSAHERGEKDYRFNLVTSRLLYVLFAPVSLPLYILAYFVLPSRPTFRRPSPGSIRPSRTDFKLAVDWLVAAILGASPIEDTVAAVRSARIDGTAHGGAFPRSALLGAAIDRYLASWGKAGLNPDEVDRARQLVGRLGQEYDPRSEASMRINKASDRWNRIMGVLPVVDCGIRLEPGELCHAVAGASYSQYLLLTTSRRYDGFSTSTTIVKGLYWRSGSYSVERTRERKRESIDEGLLYVTNRRIIFSGQVSNITIAFRRLQYAEIESDELRLVISGRRPAFFEFARSQDTVVVGETIERLLRDFDETRAPGGASGESPESDV